PWRVYSMPSDARRPAFLDSVRRPVRGPRAGGLAAPAGPLRAAPARGRVPHAARRGRELRLDPDYVRRGRLARGVAALAEDLAGSLRRRHRPLSPGRDRAGVARALPR